jgi:multiple sugar transport system substrate-binding protein
MTETLSAIGRRTMLLGAGAALAVPFVAAAQAPLEIEYWQYTFETRVRAMDELIRGFQAANPGLRVKHVHFPYADYRSKISTAMAAGQAPDIVQLYYGWLGDFQRANILAPLPAASFPAARIEAEFFPMVRAMKRDGQYWGLPTAVRSLCVFHNVRLMRAAGLDPARPPATLDEMLEAAKAMTRRDGSGNITQVGIGAGMDGQDQHWWREVLVRQFGGTPYSADGTQVTYTQPEGQAAFAWYMDLFTNHRVTARQFMDEPQAAFRAQRAGMIVDGNFRIGALERTRGLEWIVAPLPAHRNVRSNYGSYWVNGLTRQTSGAKAEAAARFLAFITTPEAMQLWLRVTGELPAREAAANTPENTNSPIYGPFVAGLREAVATDFVDELAQRQIMIDAQNRVLLERQSPEQSLRIAAEAEQRLMGQHRRA